MIVLFFYMIIQTLTMALSQSTLKMGLERLEGWTWTWSCLVDKVFLNGWIQVAVVLMVVTNVLWFWILKEFPFSVAYPLTALGFIFGLFISVFLLHETVCWNQWVGVGFILTGCLFMIR